MTFNYCPTCGTKAVDREIGDEGMMPYCTTCEKPLFPFTYTCIITLVVDEAGMIALIQQYNIPKHMYIGVAGYTKPGEPLEETVKREVFEEVGLETTDVRYVKSYPLAVRDQLMTGFVAHVKHGGFKLSAEVDNAKWFTESEAAEALPKDGIITELYLDYLANKDRL